MATASILGALRAQGFSVSLVGNDGLLITPSSTLGQARRELLRANKAEIVALLRDAKATDDALVKAAMLACDHWGDSSSDRELMRADCLAMPDHLKADLLAHFLKTYGQGPTTGRPAKTLRREADSGVI